MALPFLGQAQNLTGIWRGTFYNPTEIMFGGAKYKYEVQIDNNGRDCKGVTYSYQTTRFYGKASLVGVWSTGTRQVVIQENKMLDLKIVGGGDGCLMTCYLTYRRDGEREFLEGTYTSTNMNNDSLSCGGGKVFLEKVPESDFELEDFLKPGYKPSAKGGIKPGQEDYLVKKPASKPPPSSAAPKPASKPPSARQPATSGQKPNANSAAKTQTPKPNAPAAGQKAPAAVSKPPVKANTTTGSTAQNTEPDSKRTVVTPAEKVESENTKVTTPSLDKPVASVKPKPAPPPPLKERKNELYKTIITSARIVTISFYDNGEIDGDTITIYNNNRLVAARQGLTAKPITIQIELDENEPVQDVVMVAENLGSIPPNTALMIVQAGKQRYTLNLSSTEQKNAMVRFKYVPE